MCTANTILTPAEQGIEAAKQEARNAVKEQRRVTALRQLARGYRAQAAEYIYEDPRFTDALMEIVTDFIEEHLDVITDEDNKVELGMMLMDSIYLTNTKD